MRARSLTALVTIAVVAAGCAKSEPTAATLEEHYPVTVQDGAGRSVTISRKPTTVVRLESGPRRIVGKLKIPVKVLADDATASEIAALKPDLVITGPAASSAAVDRIEAIRSELGTPFFVMPAESLDGLPAATYRIAQLAGKPSEGRVRAAELKKARADVAAALGLGKDRRPSTTVFLDGGLGQSLPKTTMLARLIVEGGGKLVGPNDGSTVTPKKLRELNPKVYIETTQSGVGLKRLRRNPILAKLQAIREGRYGKFTVKVPADSSALGMLKQIARLLHPSAFSK